MIAQETEPHDQATTNEGIVNLWRHLFGDTTGYVAVFSGERAPRGKRLDAPQERFYAYPFAAGNAAQWLIEQANTGREAYACAHLLTDKRRIKENAAPVAALWADVDAATIPPDMPPPTAVVESSPGRTQAYWRLTRAIDPQQAEALNRRLAYAIDADRSGWDLGQLLRVPGTLNHKYPNQPRVRVVDLDPDAAYDPDQLDVILPEAGPIPTRPTTQSTDEGDVPPVRLVGSALELWQGTRWIGDAGQVDRSRTLWAIGRELAQAGATPPTIAAALADRDRALGYGKYSDRRDGGASEYARIAGKVTDELADTREFIFNAPPAGDADPDALRAENARLRTENARLIARLDRLETRLSDVEAEWSAAIRVLRNNKLQSRRVTAIAVANEVGWRLSRGEADAEGYVAVWLGGNDAPDAPPWQGREQSSGIADRAGVSRSTASRHLQDFADWGFIDRKLEARPVNAETGKPVDPVRQVDPQTGETRFVDPDTGEIIPVQWRRELKVRPCKPPAEMLAELASFEPDRPTHGGARRACPHHPDARLIIDHVARCEECGEVVDEWQTIQRPDPAPAENPHTDNESHHATPGDAPSCGGRTHMRHHATGPRSAGDSDPLFQDARRPRSAPNAQARGPKLQDARPPTERAEEGAQAFCRECGHLLPTAAARAAGVCGPCQRQGQAA